MGDEKVETGPSKDVNSGNEQQQSGSTSSQQSDADAQRDLGNLQTQVETQKDLSDLKDSGS